MYINCYRMSVAEAFCNKAAIIGIAVAVKRAALMSMARRGDNPAMCDESAGRHLAGLEISSLSCENLSNIFVNEKENLDGEADRENCGIMSALSGTCRARSKRVRSC